MNPMVPVYVGFGLMTVALILVIVATSMLSGLDKHTIVPSWYLNLMYGGLFTFFIGLVVIGFSSINMAK
jgi:hypothetical protein